MVRFNRKNHSISEPLGRCDVMPFYPLNVTCLLSGAAVSSEIDEHKSLDHRPTGPFERQGSPHSPPRHSLQKGEDSGKEWPDKSDSDIESLLIGRLTTPITSASNLTFFILHTRADPSSLLPTELNSLHLLSCSCSVTLTGHLSLTSPA